MAPTLRKFFRRFRWRGLALVLGGGVFASVAVAADETASLRVMTFNIRYAEPRDGANRWEARRDAVAKLIAAESDVAGLQEVLAGQLEDLRARLPEFDLVSRGRERDAADGEASPVLYRRDRFELVASGTFWLSDTPEEAGSRSWGNTLPRICTWVELRERRGGAGLKVFNVHLDHQSAEARRRGLVLARARAEQSGGAVVLLGDFNEGPDGPAPAELRVEDGWRDAWRERGEGDGGTFNGWRERGAYPRIDYVFYRAEGWRVTASRVLRARAGEGEGSGWVSDHFPVAVEFARTQSTTSVP